MREREVEKRERECPGSEVLNGPLEVSRNPKFFALASFLFFSLAAVITVTAFS